MRVVIVLPQHSLMILCVDDAMIAMFCVLRARCCGGSRIMHTINCNYMLTQVVIVCWAASPIALLMFMLWCSARYGDAYSHCAMLNLCEVGFACCSVYDDLCVYELLYCRCCRAMIGVVWLCVLVCARLRYTMRVTCCCRLLAAF